MSTLLEQKTFLAKVIKTLHSDWKTLDDHLRQAQWSQAKDKAHQLRGIFYLLEANDLLDSLLQIEDSNIPAISTPHFRQQLSQQIDTFCAKINQHVDH